MCIYIHLMYEKKVFLVLNSHLNIKLLIFNTISLTVYELFVLTFTFTF